VAASIRILSGSLEFMLPELSMARITLMGIKQGSPLPLTAIETLVASGDFPEPYGQIIESDND